MTQEELIEFLKSKLEIRIKADRNGDLRVILYLADEEISSDWIDLKHEFDL